MKADTTPGGLLDGVVDTTAVFPVGHSAGGGTSLRLLSRPDVTVGIPLAVGLSLMSLAGQRCRSYRPASPSCGSAGHARHRRQDRRHPPGFEYTPGQTKLVEISGSGHSTPSTTSARSARAESSTWPERSACRSPTSCWRSETTAAGLAVQGPPEVWPRSTLRDRRAALPDRARRRPGRPGQPGRRRSFDDVGALRAHPLTRDSARPRSQRDVRLAVNELESDRPTTAGVDACAARLRRVGSAPASRWPSRRWPGWSGRSSRRCTATTRSSTTSGWSQRFERPGRGLRRRHRRGARRAAR